MTDPRTCPTCGAALAADAPGSACPKCLLQAGFATGGSAALVAGGRAPTPEELAPRFPGLVIETMLGRGGMGVVYKARHKALDREVALKVLPAALAGDASFAERFQREARALAKLQHPNIVAVHDFGESVGDDGVGLFWLVMEYVDGTNIRQAMRAGQIHPKEALAIVPQICDALQYAHEHGVVHRDIKPENVLLDKSGRVKVADFGLAKMMETGAADRTLTGAGQVMGTPHYMAPEQVEHPKDVDHRADIYSLGVVFYEMLTGELPIGRFAAPSGKCDVDARIDEIVLRTLEKEREARYQRVDEVKTDVGRVSQTATRADGRAARTEVAVSIGDDVYRPDRMREAILGLVLFAGGAVAWLVWDRNPAILIAPLAGIGLMFLANFRRLPRDSVSPAEIAALRLRRIAFLVVLGVTWTAAAVWAVVSQHSRDDRPVLLAVLGTVVAVIVARALTHVRKEGPRRGWTGWAAVLVLLFCGGPLALVSVALTGAPAKPHVIKPETVSSGVSADDLQRIQAKWRRLQETDFSAGPASVISIYANEDRAALMVIAETDRLLRGGRGELGMPLLATGALAKAIGRLEIVDVTASSAGAMTAEVTAYDGVRRLRFPMRRSADGRVWDFAIGPVEVE